MFDYNESDYTDGSGRPLPATSDDSFYPDRMIPIHDDRHCPNLNQAANHEDPEFVDSFVAGAWDGWLDLELVTLFLDTSGPEYHGYHAGRTWGAQHRTDGSPW